MIALLDNEPLVKALLDAGADPDARDNKDRRPEDLLPELREKKKPGPKTDSAGK